MNNFVRILELPDRDTQVCVMQGLDPNGYPQIAFYVSFGTSFMDMAIHFAPDPTDMTYNIDEAWEDCTKCFNSISEEEVEKLYDDMKRVYEENADANSSDY